MDDGVIGNNCVCVIGRIMAGFRYSHGMYGERFFKADILVCRPSGITDAVPLMASEKMMDVDKDWSDSIVEVTGQLRSYNRHEDEKDRLELSVFVQGIRFLDGEDVDCWNNNRVCLKGFLCKKPVYRKTPLGKKIADILIAVNRPYGKSDYIPCIAWRDDAVAVSRLDVGSAVSILGRIQSREYIKVHSETEYETRVAYEVSVRELEMDGM